MMDYLEQIERLGLKVITFEQFLEEEDDYNKVLDYCEIADRWRRVNKGKPFCFVDKDGGHFSLKFLLENGFLYPKNKDIETMLEDECDKYFEIRREQKIALVGDFNSSVKENEYDKDKKISKYRFRKNKL